LCATGEKYNVLYSRSIQWISGFLAILMPQATWGAPIIDVSQFLPDAGIQALIRTVGLTMDHRSYEPATPLGTALGLSLGLEVTAVQPPAELNDAINSMNGATGSSGSANIPIIPSAKFHLHKGLGQFVDVGFSFLPPVGSIPQIQGSFFFGAELKIVLLEQEEGLTWAVRTSYNINKLRYQDTGQDISIRTTTITPQFIISKKLLFADPYIGMATQFTSGTLDASFSIPVPEIPAELAEYIPSLSAKKEAKGFGLYCFGGIDIRPPATGLKFTLEGAYSPYGLNSLGTKIGFAF
jgi:hypothetical protein